MLPMIAPDWRESLRNCKTNWWNWCQTRKQYFHEMKQDSPHCTSPLLLSPSHEGGHEGSENKSELYLGSTLLRIKARFTVAVKETVRSICDFHIIETKTTISRKILIWKFNRNFAKCFSSKNQKFNECPGFAIASLQLLFSTNTRGLFLLTCWSNTKAFHMTSLLAPMLCG